MIDIVIHRCPAMSHDPYITRAHGRWMLHQGYIVDTYYEDKEWAPMKTLSTEITHCPWCGKAL